MASYQQSAALYAQYQMAIHGDDPSECSESEVLHDYYSTPGWELLHTLVQRSCCFMTFFFFLLHTIQYNFIYITRLKPGVVR